MRRTSCPDNPGLVRRTVDGHPDGQPISRLSGVRLSRPGDLREGAGRTQDVHCSWQVWACERDDLLFDSRLLDARYPFRLESR